MKINKLYELLNEVNNEIAKEGDEIITVAVDSLGRFFKEDEFFEKEKEALNIIHLFNHPVSRAIVATHMMLEKILKFSEEANKKEILINQTFSPVFDGDDYLFNQTLALCSLANESPKLVAESVLKNKYKISTNKYYPILLLSVCYCTDFKIKELNDLLYEELRKIDEEDKEKQYSLIDEEVLDSVMSVPLEISENQEIVVSRLGTVVEEWEDEVDRKYYYGTPKKTVGEYKGLISPAVLEASLRERVNPSHEYQPKIYLTLVPKDQILACIDLTKIRTKNPDLIKEDMRYEKYNIPKVLIISKTGFNSQGHFTPDNVSLANWKEYYDQLFENIEEPVDGIIENNRMEYFFLGLVRKSDTPLNENVKKVCKRIERNEKKGNKPVKIHENVNVSLSFSDAVKLLQNIDYFTYKEAAEMAKPFFNENRQWINLTERIKENEKVDDPTKFVHRGYSYDILFYDVKERKLMLDRGIYNKREGVFRVAFAKEYEDTSKIKILAVDINSEDEI